MTGTVCVAHAGEDTLSLWETEPLREIGRLDAAGMTGMKDLGLRRMANDPVSGYLYVSCSYANCVGVVDPKRGIWLESVPVGVAPTDICVCDGRILVCCCESESLWALDREAPSATGCVQLPGFPYSMDSSNHMLLLCCMSWPAIWSVDDTLHVADVLQLDGAPMYATKLPDKDVLATLLPGHPAGTGKLVRLRAGTGECIKALAMGMMPGIVRLAPDSSLAVAADMSEGEVLMVDPQTFNVRKRQACDMPDDILFLPEGRGVLISCMLGEMIVHLDLQGNVVSRAKTGKEPRGMALCCL